MSTSPHRQHPVSAAIAASVLQAHADEQTRELARVVQRLQVPASERPTAVDQTVAELRRDLTSAHVRNRTLLRALTRAATAPTVVGVLKGPDAATCDELVFLSNGVRLEHRWSEQHGWRYVQGESVPTTVAAVVDSMFVEDAESGGMAVVA